MNPYIQWGSYTPTAQSTAMSQKISQPPMQQGTDGRMNGSVGMGNGMGTPTNPMLQTGGMFNARIANAAPKGDLLIYSMTSAQCRYLEI